MLFVPRQPHQQKAKVLQQWQSQMNLKKSSKEKHENFIVETWRSFARNTSIHAVHYLIETTITLMEKMVWAVAIITATAVMVYTCALLSNRFRTSLTSTVFESTNFIVSEIPFAAVTVCNNNRLNYNKTEAAVEKFLPKNGTTKVTTFVMFLKILQNFEFGSFDEFPEIASEDVVDIDKLNITKVYEFMMHDCRDFFVSCWWKRTAFNCCDWFSKQRSMYGVCWSFNSFSSVGSEAINVSQSFDYFSTPDFIFKEIVEFSMASFQRRVSKRFASRSQHSS